MVSSSGGAQESANGSRDGEPELAFVPPETVDRYEIGEMLGRGGLGIVFEAWDPRLRRQVAVKLIRARRAEAVRATERFVREAQALARLSHPNVVGVFAVGATPQKNTAYVVMQRIDGRTLSAWLGEDERTLPALVEVFVGAGRGLAAAHAAGVTHRDFKPDNVMVERDGGVRVLDFGLALLVGSETHHPSGEEQASAAQPPVEDGLDESWSSRSLRLTQDGIVMGTPRYMAPEQHRGRAVGPAADQFAFCLAMLRALRHGRSVYPQGSIRNLIWAKTHGEVLARGPDDLAPAWMESVLRRGLRPDPRERWPDMTTLLAALEGRRRRRWLPVAAAGVVLAGSLAVAASLGGGRVDCSEGADRVSDAFAQNKDELAVALTPGVLEPLEERMAADGTQWSAAFEATCEAREQDALGDLAFDRRMACLRVAADERERLLARLRAAPDEGARRTPEALTRLPDIASCADDAAVAAQLPLPHKPEDRERAERLRAHLRELDRLGRDARLEEGRGLVDIAVREAQAIGFEPLVAETELARGEFLVQAGDYEGAEASLIAAMTTGEAARHDFVAASAATGLVYLYTARLRKVTKAQRLLAHAQALVARVGPRAGLMRKMVSSQSALYAATGQHDRAHAVLEEALLDMPRSSASEKLDTSIMLNNLGISFQRRGDFDAGAETLREALALREDALGPGHPKLGTLLLNLGNTQVKSGRLREAEANYERALTLMRDALGADHIELARPFLSRGVTRKKQGRYDEARGDYQESLRILRLHPEAPQHMEAMVLANLGNLEKRSGRYPEALARHEEALAIREAAEGAESSDVADSLGDIGTLLRAMGQDERAREHFERSLRISLGRRGPDHPELVASHLRLGNLAFDQGRDDDAARHLADGERIAAKTGTRSVPVALLWAASGRLQARRGDLEGALRDHRRSLKLLIEQGTGPGQRGRVRFDLAVALYATGEVALAHDALASARVELREAGPAEAEMLAELEATVAQWTAE